MSAAGWCCRALFYLIRFYRVALSPLLGRRCRFYPSCSVYAEEAIAKYGWRGLYLVGRRLARCHPFGAGGYDPLP
ncbi:MAG: membrane protein insertion efficiency factor YidD [Clostridia bacterium]|nr:membrane protein insertion efficiency factor YidD [Clostridia bacterium]